MLRNTDQRYGAVAIVLHWLMAVLLIALIVQGLYMTGLPDVGFNKQKILHILAHKEYGMLALGLAAIRLAWRLGNVLPVLVENLPDWQKVAARFVHLSFYGLMFALPISGWLMSSAVGIPVYVFGYRLPDLIAHDERLFQLFIDLHKWLSYALIGLIIVHAGAALRHHFFGRDDTLKKILPAERA
ncbi:cytochrome b561 [Microbulbifer donghaiensis]|uniref:Cytochrome b561 n=1 Tax=Microbulbifer donghaiensis TaxID=494016 RepID=A0A1M4USP2_9GAMM|nr:cytochrome b [Microbulbifer donghaiensis]SHE59647.1 cytochrome b561 [Microbulbifer donghaiensis]